jgi:hypothetical protein
MSDVFFKPSHKIDSFFPDNFSVDSENFLIFIKAYYEWLQTTRIEISNVSGTFQRNEIVTGQTSGAYGIIREVGTGYIVVLVQSTLRFSRKEILVGSTSNATANIVKIKDNTIRATGNLLEYRDIEKSIDDYVEYLREELFPTIPTKYIEDKKLVATKLKSFFESRSSEESYRFLFKLLYNENIEFRFPGEEILRASDGKFEKTNFIRVVPVQNIFNFINKTIRGQTSNAFATVVDIKKFLFGATEVAEFTLKLVSGTFLPNETIVDVLDSTLTTTTFGMITGFNIVNGGSGYFPGNLINISGNGNGAIAVVSSTTSSSVGNIFVSGITNFGIGIGYQIGTEATVDNTSTLGSGLVIRVTEIENPYTVVDTVNAISYEVGDIKTLSIINPGTGYQRAPIITIEDTTIKNLGLLSERLITIDNGGNLYEVGDQLVFTGSPGSGANGNVAGVDEIFANRFISELSANTISEFETTRLDEPYERNNIFLEDGFSIILESSFFDELKLEEWAGVGPITRVELTDFGSGYTNESLPTISVSSANGSLAQLTVRAVQGTGTTINAQIGNISGIGTIRAVQIVNSGLNYTTATADATISGDGNAVLIPIISALFIKEGEFLNDDGKIGIRVLIDSFFFQDFSYVIKSGLPFSTYRDELKKIIHPAGLQPFGEILLQSSLDLRSNFVALELNNYKISIESQVDLGLDMFTLIDTLDMKLEVGPFVSVAVVDASAISVFSIEKEIPIEIDNSQLQITIPSIAKFIETEIDLGLDMITQIDTLDMKLEVVSFASVSVANAFIIGKSSIEKETLIQIDNSQLQITIPSIAKFIETEIDLGFNMLTLIDTLDMKLEVGPFVSVAVVDASAIAIREFELDLQSDFVASLNVESKVDKKRVIENLIIDNFQVDDVLINRIVEVESDVNASIQTLLNKYKQIQGTISSSSGSEYKDLLLSDFENEQISTISGLTFETTLSLITGNGTIFTVDFSTNDQFLANNELFTVTNVFSNTSLVADRDPIVPFTDIFAYKLIS